MWGAVLGFGAKIFSFVGKLLDWRENRAHERLGRQDEQIDQWERARDAEELIDSVEPPSRDDTVDRLRKGEF